MLDIEVSSVGYWFTKNLEQFDASVRNHNIFNKMYCNTYNQVPQALEDILPEISFFIKTAISVITLISIYYLSQYYIYEAKFIKCMNKTNDDKFLSEVVMVFRTQL